MDWRNRETDYASVDDYNLEENRLVSKSRSDASLFDLGDCDFCSQETQISPCDFEDPRNIASVLSRLHLEASEDNKEEMIPPFDDRGTQTCRCAHCLENEESSKELKSREMSSMRLVVHGPEILNYQGIQYGPEDIARYWKKDSRMWLWKSVRLARRKMIESSKQSLVRFSDKAQDEKCQ